MALILSGSLTLKSSVIDTTTTTLGGPFGLETVEIGGRTFVYAAANIESGLTVFELGTDGSLTPIQTIDDTDTTALHGAANLI